MEFLLQIAAVTRGEGYSLLFQRCQRNRDHILSTSLSKENSNFPMICREWSLSISMHDLFTTEYQDCQAKPGNMRVPVKSSQTPEEKWEPNILSGGKE